MSSPFAHLNYYAMTPAEVAQDLDRRFADLEPDDYLGRFKRIVAGPYDFAGFIVRMPLCREFAFAVPTEEALEALVALGPIVELGAGTGYWAYLLGKRGVDIIAYDWRPVIEPYRESTPFRRVQAGVEGAALAQSSAFDFESGSYHDDGVNNHYRFTRQWTKVVRGTPEVLATNGHRALFLCWPDYDTSFASDALDAYTRAGGKTIAYIGEGEGGCTGNDLFHSRLYREWKLERRIQIPHWPSVHDDLSIYRALPPSEWRTDDDASDDSGDEIESDNRSDWAGATVGVTGGDFDGAKGKVT